MQFAAILEILAVLLPAFIGFSNTKLFKGKTKWIVIIAAYFILKKWAAVAAADKARGDIQNAGGGLNSNSLATLYKQALNPSGYDTLIELDGTNEEVIFLAAAQTRNFREVFEAYKKQYKRDLTDDLQKELSTEDYQKFLKILNQ